MAFTRANDTIDDVKNRLRHDIAEALIAKNLLIPDVIFHLDLAEFIPNFIGYKEATARFCELAEWKNARRVFITPDRSTELLRQVAIEQGKEIVMTTHGIRRGALLLDRSMVPKGQEEFAATLDGFERFAKPLTRIADVVAAGPVDFMITGALFVSGAHGGRGGKGCGWFDSEWIMWQKLGLSSEKTPVGVLIHDAQVAPEAFPLQPWDVKCNFIATPTRLIKMEVTEQPTQILWSEMDPAWRVAIPLMQELYEQMHH